MLERLQPSKETNLGECRRNTYSSFWQLANLINILRRDDDNVRITSPHNEDAIFVLLRINSDY
jgi:hypothetical protein